MNSSHIRPEFSIIMSARNSELYLVQSLESIVKYAAPFNYELIVYEDASTDSTHEILNCYKTSIPMKIIRGSRMVGSYRGRNVAIDDSNSNLIFILDSDDLLTPARIPKTLQTFLSHPEIDVVTGLARRYGEWGMSSQLIPKIRSNIEIFNLLRSGKNPIIHSATAFKKNAFLESGKYPESGLLSQDYGLFLKMVKSNNLKLIPEVFVHYYSPRQYVRLRYAVTHETFAFELWKTEYLKSFKFHLPGFLMKFIVIAFRYSHLMRVLINVFRDRIKSLK